MRVGLLGGVFNPPHFGHLMIARQILDFTDIEEVWFLPNYGQSPAKPGVATPSDRLAMAQLLRLPGARVSSIEIDNKLDGKTIRLLPLLPPEHSYVFLMGSDWLPAFPQWDRWEELLERLPFYVFPRNGHPVAPLYPNMTEVKHELLITSDISSTKVRQRMEWGLSVGQFVPPAVLGYILEHKLYAAPTS